MRPYPLRPVPLTAPASKCPPSASPSHDPPPRARGSGAPSRYAVVKSLVTKNRGMGENSTAMDVEGEGGAAMSLDIKPHTTDAHDTVLLELLATHAVLVRGASPYCSCREIPSALLHRIYRLLFLSLC